MDATDVTWETRFQTAGLVPVDFELAEGLVEFSNHHTPDADDIIFEWSQAEGIFRLDLTP